MAEGTDSISVAVCTHNGAAFVAEQLESIAAQTRLPDEIVVCDDRSHDDTVTIVEQFAAIAPVPLRLVINSAKLGVVKNFEQAIASCGGDLIALCDQDDIWLPEKLARLEAEFDRAPEVGLVFSDAELVDENGRRLKRRLWEQIGFERAERERLRKGRGLADLLAGATVTGATMAFRSIFKNLILPIPDDLSIIHDAWIALLIASVTEVWPMEEPLVLYREHTEQQVGPRPRKISAGGLSAVTTGTASAAAVRSNPYDATLKLAGAARARLGGIDKYDSRKARATLDAVTKHFETRKGLSRHLSARLPAVLRELLTMRYFRFSSGVWSAAKDIVRKS